MSNAFGVVMVLLSLALGAVLGYKEYTATGDVKLAVKRVVIAAAVMATALMAISIALNPMLAVAAFIAILFLGIAWLLGSDVSMLEIMSGEVPLISLACLVIGVIALLILLITASYVFVAAFMMVGVPMVAGALLGSLVAEHSITKGV